MATLEVHDSRGRVQFVELARDHPVLFGTSAACDVVLEGDGIRPVHGRIRFKKEKYRIEASPDAEFVVINGHKMTTSSLHQGDEITLGGCRIFMLRGDDDRAPARVSRGAVDEGKTRVLDPRGAPALRESGRGGKGSHASGGKRGAPTSPTRPGSPT